MLVVHDVHVCVCVVHCSRRNAFGDKGKRTTWKLPVKFYFGQNEDCSLGDCTSESSEKLLQRDRWRKVSIYMILVKGEIHAIKHMFFQKFSAGQEEQFPP